MFVVPATLSWALERDLLLYHGGVHHHVHNGMHLHISAAVPAYKSSLEPRDWIRMYEHACFPGRGRCFEQFQRFDDLLVSVTRTLST